VLFRSGLVRVHLSKDKDSKHESKSYALREQPLADAGHFLDSYVRTGVRDLPVPTEGES